MRRRASSVVGGGLLVAAALAIALALVAGQVAKAPGSKARTIVVTVPQGTAEQVARGERVEAIPARIAGRVGDTLRLVNEDDVAHMVGPFFVAPKQELSTPLTRAGIYNGSCTVTPDSDIQIVVRN
ncbi:MAG: hypothetical protein LT070_07735 [Solirubrobacteraceae bacterium]|nr:hypothetical protein [Solirubrobacteraceae bacterium]